MGSVNQMRRTQRAEGPATVMAIGTATPPNWVDQSTFPDFYFRVTGSNHMTDLKEKMKRICEKSMIKKRYMHLTEEILKENSNICANMAPSLDARQEILSVEIPKLAKEAAEKALEEWGQPRNNITHLVFSTTVGAGLPGPDSQLAQLLNLSPSVQRVSTIQIGCYSGAALLRVAKDLAENNKGARVLCACADITAAFFRGPNYIDMDNLVVQSLFGDAAAAVIVGSDPIPGVERPLFELVSTAQTILPETHTAIRGLLREVGLKVHLSKEVASLIAHNIENNLEKAFKPLGVSDWNSIFWVVHPGGRAILDQVEKQLGLKPEKLRATRHVLSEYGNIQGAGVMFILEEMRTSAAYDGQSTLGEGLGWGALCGFGPGLTLEIVVLHAVSA